MLDTRPRLLREHNQSAFPALRRGELTTLQVNLGYLCNLSCTHCHVNAGPKRTELMNRATVESVLEFLAQRHLTTLDLTGGAPEMNPHFRYLVTEARSLGVSVIDRCNLTILEEPGYEDMAEFLAENQVIVTASLPCYSEQNVERQRGKGVFHDSIQALQRLNSLGYGRKAQLELNLVYNPDGLNLPPDQLALEADYKRVLCKDFGIEFNQLYTITNMPISRFGGMLLAKGLYDEYMEILRRNFTPANLQTVMCRSLLSVDYQGYVYDCDFNQMLQLPLVHASRDILGTDRARTHLSQLLDEELTGRQIAVADHCYGCTAGQGSSCGGALAQ
jgi:radical SAM/Cys-rich protein